MKIILYKMLKRSLFILRILNVITPYFYFQKKTYSEKCFFYKLDATESLNLKSLINLLKERGLNDCFQFL